MDLLPERDVESKIAAHRLLRMIAADETESSTPLFDALRAGTPVDAVPEWRETINNVRASNAHYQELVSEFTSHVLAQENVPETVLQWLQDAERNGTYLTHRLNEDPLSADSRHLSVWRSAFEDLLAMRG